MEEAKKSPQNPSEKSSEWQFEEPKFPEDPAQFSEAELREDPAKRFHVNPADFPIFSEQAEKGPAWGDRSETLPLDETMSRFVTATADTVAIIAGEDEGLEGKPLPAADHIVYLDKSARPVCWLVNNFWDAFTDKKRPNHSFLAIDRKEWFARTNTPIEGNEYIRDEDGSARLAKFPDFRAENVSREDIARIRATFIPGGIETEDVDEIMKTPTGLDGKNITVIDEVSRSGSTLAIAKHLISLAIPEAASVNGHAFWDAGQQTHPYTGESQMRGVPVWYDPNTHIGRGIGDVNESFFAERHERFNTPKTRAQKFGAIVLGQFINLNEEPGNRSRKLASEIRTMRKEWDEGHILMSFPKHYNQDKWAERIESQGMRFVPPDEHKGRPAPKDAFTHVVEDIHKRKPVPPHSV